LDYFRGGTGSSTLATGFRSWAIDEIGITGTQSSPTVLTNTLNSCRSIDYNIDLSGPPTGGSWRFYIESSNYSGIQTQGIMCNIAGASTSCAGTLAFTYAAGNDVHITTLDLSGAPTAVSARWAVKCTAP